jgi:hypothetical protein
MKEVHESLLRAKNWALNQASSLRGTQPIPEAPPVNAAAGEIPPYARGAEKVAGKPNYVGPKGVTGAPAHYPRGRGPAAAEAFLKEKAAAKAAADTIKVAPGGGATPTLRAAANAAPTALRAAGKFGGPVVGAAFAAKDAMKGDYTGAVDAATLGTSAYVAPVLGPLVTYGLQKARDAALEPVLRATGVMPADYNPNVITPAMQKALQEQDTPRAVRSEGTAPTMLDRNTRIADRAVQPGASTTAVTLGSNGPYGTAPANVPTVAAASGRAIDPSFKVGEGEGAFVNSRGQGTVIKTAPRAQTGVNLNAYAPHQGGTGAAAPSSRLRAGDRGVFGFMVDTLAARGALENIRREDAIGLRNRTQDIALEKARLEAAGKALDRQIAMGQWGAEQRAKRAERAQTGLDSFADSVADVDKNGKPLQKNRDEFRGMVALSLSRQGKDLADATPADIQTLQNGYAVKRIIDSNRSYFGDQRTSRDLNDYAPVASRTSLTGKEYLFPSGQWVSADVLYGDKMRLFRPNDPRRADIVRYLEESVAQAQAKQATK